MFARAVGPSRTPFVRFCAQRDATVAPRDGRLPLARRKRTGAAGAATLCGSGRSPAWFYERVPPSVRGRGCAAEGVYAGVCPPPFGGWMAIHLGRPLPDASSNQPGRRRENPLALRRAIPIRSCSRWGLPCRPRCRVRGALLPHPFTLTCRSPRGAGRRFAFCGTFPRVAPAGRYPAPCFRGARTFLGPDKRGRGHPTL